MGKYWSFLPRTWNYKRTVFHLFSKMILRNAAAAAAAKSLQSCPTLRNPIDSSPLDSSVPGILQTRIPKWVAISFSNTWKWKAKIESEVAQLCPTLCDPMDCSLPGSSVHGIFQARVHNSLIQGMLDKLFLTQWPRSVNMNNLRLGWRIEAIALDLGLRMMFYPASWTLL